MSGPPYERARSFMPDGEKVLRVVREWVEKAENDLEAAARLLRSGRDFPADVVCFHAQQCVEKYVKAYLTSLEIDFPKTHDLGVLVSLMPLRARPKLTVPEQRTLTVYATVTRYPGEQQRDRSRSTAGAKANSSRSQGTPGGSTERCSAPQEALMDSFTSKEVDP